MQPTDRMEIGPDGNLYVQAPAKVNLFLHITGRRADGYHVIESLFAFTRRGDLLRLAESPSFSFSVTGPFADELAGTSPEDNLVVRAARLLAREAGVSCNVSIELEKNLPVASGLGGGSADAAAALVGLNEFWRLGLTNEALEALALDIGADVPACISSTPQIVSGIGEKLTPTKLDWHAGIVIVNPLKPVSTPDVFAGFHEFRTSRGLPPYDVKLNDLNQIAGDLSMLGVLTSNSLQDPAAQLCTDIMVIERFLRLNSDYELIRMSGSGASVFALYHDRKAAEAVARRVKEHNPHWWVMADELVRS